MLRMTWALAAAIVALLWTTSANSAESCNRVVSYFLFPYQGSLLKQHEWRVFDPTKRTDQLFLTMPNGVGAGGFDGVRWDTTYRMVFFNSGDSLYRIEWKFGAKPKLIGRLPHVLDPEGWWFNPDSSCWQVAGMRAMGSPDTARFYRCEVWQSTKDVTSWRVIRSDTVLYESGEPYWPWSEEPWARRAPAVTLEDASKEASADAWFGKASGFDTATVTVAAENGKDGWHFIPSETHPRRGVAFRLMYSSEILVSAPFYFVDLDSRTKTLISSPDDLDSWTTWLLSEHCGLMLLPGVRGTPSLIDAATGKVLFSRPWNSADAVWVAPPTSP